MTHSTCAGRRVCAPKNLGWVSAAVGAAFLALYGATLCRGVYPGASAAWISQAEGFSPWMSGTHPLWRLCVGLWQRIPGCGGGGGLNALSALCGAVAAALFCRYAARWVYSAIRVEREAALNPAETSAAGGATEDDAREERLVSRVAVASGVFAAALFGTGLAVWSASTRFQPEAFDLAWVWAALALYQSYTLRRGLWRLYALVLLCGLGAVETTMFWVAAPFLLGAVTAFLYKHHRLRFGLCAGLLLTGLLGLGFYGVSAYGFAQSAAGSGWREAFRQMAALQLREVALYLPARGWPFVLALLVVPWLVFQMGYWSRLHLRRDFRSDTLMGVALVATVLLQFGVPLPPWTQWRLIGRLPVLESSLAAMLGGWAFAYWAYGAVFRWEPAKLVAGKEARRFETLVRYKRWLSMGLCSLLLALSVAAACRSGWLADGRRGAFADRCAQEILGQLGGRTWLVSDGSLDPHLKALAAAQGRTLRVLSLAAECDPGLVRQIRRWVSEEPRMQANRDRLLNAADLGAGAFVREWLAVDPEAENALALYCVPDLWTAAGLVPRPDRFLFFARRSADGLESRPLLEEQRVFWARMRPLLPPVEDVREPSDRLRRSLRGHLSLVANDLGVLLMDLGRGEEAFDAFGDSLLWDPRNLSALANRALLVGKGVRPAEKDSAEAAFKKAVAFFKRQPRAFDVVRLYGQLRTPAAVFGVGAVWAQGGQYGLAQGGLLRAAALEEEGDRRDAILACLGGMNVEAGETGQGEEIFRNLLKKDPRNLVALMGMLNLSLRNGDADAAGKWLAQARDAGANETSVAFA